ASQTPPAVSKLAPCTAHTSSPSFDARNWPGAQSRRRPACGQTLSQARTAPSASRWRISDSASPSTTASASAKPPAGILSTSSSAAAGPWVNASLTSSVAMAPILTASPKRFAFWHYPMINRTFRSAHARFDASHFGAMFAPRKPRHPLLRLLVGLLGLVLLAGLLVVGV